MLARSQESLLKAHRANLTQSVAWPRATNIMLETPKDVERLDLTEYPGALSDRGLSGVSRTRKLAAIRDYCCLAS